MKWVVLGGKDQEVRFHCLSEFLNARGLKNQVQLVNPSSDDFFLELEKLVETQDQIRLQSPFSELAQNFRNRSTEMVNLLGTADALVKKADGSWWPENFLFEAFSFEFIKHVKRLDLNSHVLIVGSGAGSKVAVAALVRAGFSKFYISDKFEERARVTIEKLKRNFFNIEFNFISHSSVMLLPGSSSVLVNGTPLIPENDILKDLYYFNFLRHPAVIADLNLIPPEPPLIEEGRNVDAQVICGYEIAAKVDALWAKDALNLDLDLPAYKELLKKKLAEIPFDTTPYRLG